MEKAFIMRNNRAIGMQPPDRVYTSTPIGIIQAFSGTTIPRGFLLCDGQSYAVAEYPDLYAVIGNTYGGDSTNFNVPNLVDKFIQGSATSGTEKEAGLPNITGQIGNNSDSHAIFYAPTTNGAFTGSKKAKLAGGGSSSGEWYASALLDASRSNAIYGNSDTVQPPALTMIYIIKAFHTNEGVDETVELNDNVVNHINNEIGKLITNDDDPSADKTWSSAKIDDMFKWKLLGYFSIAGSTTRPFPENTNELYFVLKSTTTILSPGVIIPVAMLEDYKDAPLYIDAFIMDSSAGIHINPDRTITSDGYPNKGNLYIYYR